jgi:ribosomal protein L3
VNKKEVVEAVTIVETSSMVVVGIVGMWKSFGVSDFPDHLC